MVSRTRIAMATAVGAALLMTVTAGTAVATPRGVIQPHAVTGDLIENGADGKPHTLLCPPEENVYSGGFSISPAPGHQLDERPADIIESHPNDDATGWIVAVRKDNDHPQDHSPGEKDNNEHPQHHGPGNPANLTISIICTEGENTPGG